jgi:hypothetical protein
MLRINKCAAKIRRFGGQSLIEALESRVLLSTSGIVQVSLAVTAGPGHVRIARWGFASDD